MTNFDEEVDALDFEFPSAPHKPLTNMQLSMRMLALIAGSAFLYAALRLAFYAVDQGMTLLPKVES